MPRKFWQAESEEEEDAGKAVEKKFESLETTVKEIKDNSISKTDFQSVADSVKAINARFAAEDEARKKAAERKQQQERQQQQENYDPEKEFETFAADPKAYIQQMQQPTNQATLLALGRQKVSEVLASKPYYHGDFKTKVDALIFGEPNGAQWSNPSFIINCYRVVYAEFAEEDKLKDMKRSASLEMGGDGGSEGDSKEGKDAKPTISFRSNTQYSDGKAKAAAAALGLTDEDIVNTAKEGTIKGLEVLA